LLKEASASAPKDDEEMRIALALRSFALGSNQAAAVLVGELEAGKVPLLRDDALQALATSAGEDFGYDPWSELTEATNTAATKRWKQWLAANNSSKASSPVSTSN